MIPLSERITLELRHRNPIEVTELILDTSKAEKIEGLSDEYVNLKELSLVNIGLKTLVGFPKLMNLEKLDLSDNRILGDLDCLTFCPKLTQLFLTNNRIGKMDVLNPLTKLQHLEVLDLTHCAVSEIDNYRQNVFDLLPQLVYLDGYDQTETEESESEYYEDDEDYNDDFPVSRAKFSQMSGKNGKYCSMLHYEDELNKRDYMTFENDFYEESVEDQDLLCYVEENDKEEIEEYKSEKEVDDDESYLPSTHGSKYRVNDIQCPQRFGRKRSCSSTDEYDSTWKMYIKDSSTSVPSLD